MKILHHTILHAIMLVGSLFPQDIALIWSSLHVTASAGASSHNNTSRSVLNFISPHKQHSCLLISGWNIAPSSRGMLYSWLFQPDGTPGHKRLIFQYGYCWWPYDRMGLHLLQMVHETVSSTEAIEQTSSTLKFFPWAFSYTGCGVLNFTLF